jgi:proline dehydrogenase
VISNLLLRAAENKRLERIASESPLSKGIVQRYVAGTTLDEAISATQSLQRQGIQVSLDLLGEHVSDLSESAKAAAEYVEAIKAIADRAPGATVSVKLSQLGISMDPQVCARHLEDLVQAAAAVGVDVEVDMEHSSVGPATLEAYRRILAEYPRTRVAVQAAIRRTRADLESFTDPKPRIRLVKGAFKEDLDVAVLDKREVGAQYRALSGYALRTLPDPAFGTHDSACIDHIKLVARDLGVSKADFEFQMLYGVRRDVQRRLADEGYRVRVYLPYGTQWYPYLMRRMAERPANLLLFLRSVVGK